MTVLRYGIISIWKVHWIVVQLIHARGNHHRLVVHGRLDNWLDNRLRVRLKIKYLKSDHLYTFWQN